MTARCVAVLVDRLASAIDVVRNMHPTWWFAVARRASARHGSTWHRRCTPAAVADERPGGTYEGARFERDSDCGWIGDVRHRVRESDDLGDDRIVAARERHGAGRRRNVPIHRDGDDGRRRDAGRD